MGGGGSPARGSMECAEMQAVARERDELREEVMRLRMQTEKGGDSSMRRVEELEELLGEREGRLREVQGEIGRVQAKVKALAKANEQVGVACSFAHH